VFARNGGALCQPRVKAASLPLRHAERREEILCTFQIIRPSAGRALQPASPSFGRHEDSGATAEGSKPDKNDKPRSRSSGAEFEATTARPCQARESSEAVTRLPLLPLQRAPPRSCHTPNMLHTLPPAALPNRPILWPAQAAVVAVQMPGPPCSH